MDIAALLLWLVTAGAGLYLLLSGRPAIPVTATPEPATVPPSPPAPPAQTGLPQATVDALRAGARVPPITHTRVTAPPGQHPLLEFMHPALGLIGLGAWIGFVITGFHTFAWVAFGVLLATIAAGLTWYTINSRLTAAGAARSAQPAAPGGRRPPRRVLIHGGAAGATLVLALITLLITVQP